jgi:Uncharacterized protein conserved in bacteria (DUF2059)
MNGRTIFWPVVILIAALSAAARASVPLEPSGAAGGRSITDMAGIQTVNTLMERSGLNTQVRNYPAVLRQNLARAQQQRPQFSARQFQALNLMIAKAFNADRMIDTVRNHMHTRLTENDVSAVLAWLNSPLGKRITRLEEEASAPGARTGGAGAGGAAQDDQERIERLRKLDRSVKASEAAASSALNFQVAMLTAMTAAMAPELRPAFDAVLAEARKRSEQARPVLEQRAFEQLQRVYRPLSDGEIDQYIDFAESEAGKKFHTVVIQGMQEATLNASRELGTMIGKGVTKKKER